LAGLKTAPKTAQCQPDRKIWFLYPSLSFAPWGWCIVFGMSRPCKTPETNMLPAIRTDEQANDNWHPVLRRSEAAKMCRISLQTFDTWVRKGILPGPIAGTRRWSRRAIERRLEGRVATESATEKLSPFEQWKRGYAH
jgi:hypothetical protein